jgi:predicted RNA binding protein YcfA (HicA-like mRNA interferase family)
MNRKKLERYLTQQGCAYHSHGGDHDKWRRQGTPFGTVLPRHKEIKPGTVKAICKDLGIPLPPEK